MNLLFKVAGATVILVSATLLVSQKSLRKNTRLSNRNEGPDQIALSSHTKSPVRKIQAAILLDVSNSMDGLIAQAKAQLWNMVTVMGKATCEGQPPEIEIALYEYGRDTNDPSKGYVKQINSFTTDLDQLSENLFSLSTNGGDEYCGHVIYSSLNELPWDHSADNYKVIFIAGNEDFLQGDIQYSRSCTRAKEKGVIVNTIYCGDRQQGIQEHWNLGSECGAGSFTNINADAAIEEIATPYDDSLFLLNDQLNNTYIAYGYAGQAGAEKQQVADQKNYLLSKSAAVKRVTVKSKKGLYNNAEWDLVDATEKDSSLIEKLDMKTLPETLQNTSRPELKKLVEAKADERNRVQREIGALNRKRETFIQAERAKNAAASNEQTLETEIEKIIRQQARQFNMVIQK